MSLDPCITAAFGRESGFPLEPHLVVLALMGSLSHHSEILALSQRAEARQGRQ